MRGAPWRVSSPNWKHAGLKPSFQHGVNQLRKTGLFPPVGSNWMRDTIISAAREVGTSFRTANAMRRGSGLSLEHSRLPPNPLRAACFSLNAQRREVLLIAMKGDYSIGLDGEVAGMFDASFEMLPERAGNRMAASIDTRRTRALAWAPSRNLLDYSTD